MGGGRVALLTMLEGHVVGEVVPEEAHVLVSWRATERRCGSALYTAEGKLVAAAHAGWISVSWDGFARATGIAIRPIAGL